jgi:hypothetical protein
MGCKLYGRVAPGWAPDERNGDFATVKIPSSDAVMTFLFKIEEVFEVPTRGCVIVPIIEEGADFRIRTRCHSAPDP